MVNEKLAEFVKTSKPSVAVVGLGGAGCNITTWIAEKGMAGGKIIAANTDVNHLSTMSKADKLVKKICRPNLNILFTGSIFYYLNLLNSYCLLLSPSYLLPLEA